jgi:hypothetical protein
VILKIVPKAAMNKNTLEKIYQRERRNAGEEIYAACETVFRISLIKSVFK